MKYRSALKADTCCPGVQCLANARQTGLKYYSEKVAVNTAAVVAGGGGEATDDEEDEVDASLEDADFL